MRCVNDDILELLPLQTTALCITGIYMLPNMLALPWNPLTSKFPAKPLDECAALCHCGVAGRGEGRQG
eukprot:scaffold371460_cov37-Prasinocladus_malaysianus.AAC.1